MVTAKHAKIIFEYVTMAGPADDPVIKQFQVYLSQELRRKLYFVMYPTQTPAAAGQLPCIKYEVKPENKQMRVEFAVDTRSINYDHGKGEHMALSADGLSAGKDERMFRSGVLDKLVLESTSPVSSARRYAVAVVHNNELHFSPLHACVEMRNYYPYLDACDKRAKEKAKGQSGGGDNEEDEPKQITVKFARQESERVKKARERSFNFLSKKSAEEPWYRTEYYPNHSERSECLRSLLLCPSPEEQPRQMDSFGPKQFINLLCPITGIEDGAFGTPEMTLRHLKALPIVDRVRHFLQRGGAMSFDELLALLEGDVKPLDVVRALQQVGLFVQGNWVAKSDELYRKDGEYGAGLSAEDMCKGRDFVVAQFVRSHCIQLSVLKDGTHLPTEQLREILEPLAFLRPRQGWEFKLPFNGSFISRFPEVAQRQQVLWEVRMKNM